ncbi:hypothetical protein B0J17DRAFT_115857 [Rhizoctonia solani]|nr:hypothetical protein B0J17DRAFT_115857 [Rhizoctonia solani]
MQSLKRCLIYIVVVALLPNDVTARSTNRVIYSTNPTYITYDSGDNFYTRYEEYGSWGIRDTRSRSWGSEVYHNRRSRLSSVVIEFEGSEAWLSSSPRRRAPTVSVEYEICLHREHLTSSETLCYQVNNDEDYSIEDDYEASAAKEAPEHQESQTVESLPGHKVGLDDEQNSQPSRTADTTGEPIPQPASPPTPCRAQPLQSSRPVSPSRSLPLSPSPRSVQRPRSTRRPVHRRRPSSWPAIFSSSIFWLYVILVGIWMALALAARLLRARSKERERRRWLAQILPPRRGDNSRRLQNSTPIARPPPSHPIPPLYYISRDNSAISPSSVVSESSTVPPSYVDVLREQEQDFQQIER